MSARASWLVGSIEKGKHRGCTVSVLKVGVEGFWEAAFESVQVQGVLEQDHEPHKIGRSTVKLLLVCAVLLPLVGRREVRQPSLFLAVIKNRLAFPVLTPIILIWETRVKIIVYTPYALRVKYLL